MCCYAILADYFFVCLMMTTQNQLDAVLLLGGYYAKNFGCWGVAMPTQLVDKVFLFDSYLHKLS